MEYNAPQSKSKQSEIIPNKFEAGVVVYNVPKMVQDIDAVRHICAVLGIPKHEIYAIKRLNSARSSPPLLVIFKNKKYKWSFIKMLNIAKVNGTYARPHLNPDDLEKDKTLTRKLNDLRKRNPHTQYKICRGEIVYEIENHYVTL